MAAMQEPSVAPVTPQKGYLHPYSTSLSPTTQNKSQLPAIDLELYSPSVATSPEGAFCDSLSHSQMSVLLSPSHLPSSVSMPPWIYQKYILPKNVPACVSNLAPTPEMASNAQLLTENQALRQEIQTLDETLQD